MTKARKRPPFDVELSAVLMAQGEQLHSSITFDILEKMRAEQESPPIEEQLANRPIRHFERTVPGSDGAPDVLLSIFQRTDHSEAGPAFFHTHGGGMIMGDRFYGIDAMLDWVENLDAIGISVEYRLAPEHPDPAPIEDSFAGLKWAAENADALQFDPERLMLIGESAGAGLAAGLALLARDQGGPKVCGQVLIYPMLDDRNDTVSSHQLIGEGVWDRISNDTAWDALLGSRRYTDDVSIYVSPARARDLSGLPPAYIEVGSVDVFRDEDVAYASQIWADGGSAELHVWPGAFHGYDMAAPLSAITMISREARNRWVERTLGV
ncbi:MAG: alpha/beta hydrolase [Homoserinimonas sp.]|nr:alpha/beta hydrolase [Homoserinimonas sp.]